MAITGAVGNISKRQKLKLLIKTQNKSNILHLTIKTLLHPFSFYFMRSPNIVVSFFLSLLFYNKVIVTIL